MPLLMSLPRHTTTKKMMKTLKTVLKSYWKRLYKRNRKGIVGRPDLIIFSRFQRINKHWFYQKVNIVQTSGGSISLIKYVRLKRWALEMSIIFTIIVMIMLIIQYWAEVGEWFHLSVGVS